MNMTTPKKPATLAYAEAEHKIVSTVNSVVGSIDFYELEVIINKLAQEISKYAQAERDQAIQTYQAEMKAYQAALEEEKKKAEESKDEPKEEAKSDPETKESVAAREEIKEIDD